LLGYPFSERAMLLREHLAEPSAHHGNGVAPTVQSSSMAGGVDPSGQPGDDYMARRRNYSSDLLRCMNTDS